MKKIPLAPKLTDLLNSTGKLVGVEALILGGPRHNVDGIEVRMYGSRILLDEGKEGKFIYYRHSSSPSSLYKCEYKGPIPNNYENIYPNTEEVHLIYIEGEGRKDEFNEIPFP